MRVQATKVNPAGTCGPAKPRPGWDSGKNRLRGLDREQVRHVGVIEDGRRHRKEQQLLRVDLDVVRADDLHGREDTSSSSARRR